MLVRFAVENFLSFKEQQVFSMAAGKQSRHRPHLFTYKGKRLLKAAVIFGANASGKSNLLKAMQFGKDIVFKGVHLNTVFKKHFRIDAACALQPGLFQYDFIANENVYSYGIVVSYKDACIEAEWLYRLDGDEETMVFERKRGTETETDLVFANNENKIRFEIYAADVPDNKTLLQDIAERKLSTVDDYQAFFDAYGWFNDFYLIFPNSSYDPFLYMLGNTCDTAEKWMSHFDTGIESINGIRKPVDELLSFLPEEKKAKMIGLIMDFFEKRPKTAEYLEVAIEDKVFVVELTEEGLAGEEMLMDHGNKNDMFSFGDESDGTLRLFDLLPIYSKGKSNAVMIVDELDRSFHSKLTREFIEQFFAVTRDCPSQLIVTTHDSTLMDLELFRQDEIWFVERAEDHGSRLFSLNRFKEHYDKDIAKEYLNGRYGAVPVFSQSLIDYEGNDENEED